jgi:hypothetical protein
MAASDQNERFLDPDNDPFKPPTTNTEVGCLHCQETYDSYRIEWRVFTSADGSKHGFWCCPTPGCDGKGFGFDILPTDPNYDDGNLSCMSDDEDDDELDAEGDDYFEDDAELDDDGQFGGKKPDDPEPPSTNGHGVPW